MGSKWKKELTAVIVVTITALGLEVASLATDFWFLVTPQKSGANYTTTAEINAGLFKGYKILDNGLGPRAGSLWINCKRERAVCGWKWTWRFRSVGNVVEEDTIDSIIEDSDAALTLSNDTSIDYVNYGLFSMPLWVSTILLIGISMIFGLTSLILTIINMAIVPIETINGILGILLWNFIAALFAIAAFTTYLFLYFLQLQLNVLSDEEIRLHRWTTKGLLNVNYSFYFTVLSSLFYIVNIIIIIMARTCCTKIFRSKNTEFRDNKALTNVMMF